MNVYDIQYIKHSASHTNHMNEVLNEEEKQKDNEKDNDSVTYLHYIVNKLSIVSDPNFTATYNLSCL